MTYEQAASLVARISCAWPRYPFSEATVAIYAEFMVDLDYELSSRAVNQLVASSEWPPTIAHIRGEVLREMIDLPTPEFAWALLVRRWGDKRDEGDLGVVIADEVREALSEAGIDKYRYETTDDRARLRHNFLEVYDAIYQRIMREHNFGLPGAFEASRPTLELAEPLQGNET